MSSVSSSPVVTLRAWWHLHGTHQGGHRLSADDSHSGLLSVPRPLHSCQNISDSDLVAGSCPQGVIHAD